MSNVVEFRISGKDGFSSALKGIGVNLTLLHQSMQVINKAFRVFVDIGREVLETADAFKRMEIQLTNLSGSAAAAKGQMSDLVTLAKNTPQTVKALTDSFVKLEAGGIKNSLRALTALTDAVSAFGGTDQNLKRAAIAIQQMGSKGVISMEELRQQLGESVPVAMRVMARELKMSMKEMIDLISRGGLDAQRGIGALVTGLEKDFGGAAKTMMGTWAGATSNFQDNWDLLMVTLGDTGVLDFAIRRMQEMVSTVGSITEAIRDALDLTDTKEDLKREISQIEFQMKKSILELQAVMTATGAEGFIVRQLFGKPDEIRKEFASLAKQLGPMFKLLAEMEEGQAQFKKKKAEETSAQLQVIRQKDLALNNKYIIAELEDFAFAAEKHVEYLQALADEDLSFRQAWLAQQLKDQADHDALLVSQQGLMRELALEVKGDEFARQRLLEEENFQARLALAGENNSLMEAVKFAHEQKMTEIEKQEEQARMESRMAAASAAASLFGGLAALARQGGAKQFKFFKALALAQAITSTYVAANRAFASAPPPINYVLMAAAIAQGLANVARISSMKAPAAHGGLTNVGSEQTYMLARGERVLSPRQNQDFTDFIQSSQGGGGGGVVIEKIEIRVLENATNFESFMQMDQRDLTELIAQKIIPSLNDLDKAGVRPAFAQRGRGGI